jgi:hypothetical protein
MARKKKTEEVTLDKKVIIEELAIEEEATSNRVVVTTRNGVIEEEDTEGEASLKDLLSYIKENRIPANNPFTPKIEKLLTEVIELL